MRRPLLLLFFALDLFSGMAVARSPVGDWQSVQDIPVGWQITVVTEFTFPCIFARASNEELICKALQRNGAAVEPGEIQVRRDRIHEVRVERRDGANMLAGAAGAGGAGAILGTIITTASRGPAAYILGIAGASHGRPHPSRPAYILHAYILHEVIYRRARAGKNPNVVQGESGQ